MIRLLQVQFLNVKFEVVDHCYYPRNEDAVYQGAPPSGHTVYGEFIRMTNKLGGGDTISADKPAEILRCAAYHQSVS